MANVERKGYRVFLIGYRTCITKRRNKRKKLNPMSLNFILHRSLLHKCANRPKRQVTNSFKSKMKNGNMKSTREKL